VKPGDQLLISDRPDHSPSPIDDKDPFDTRVHHDLDDATHRSVRRDHPDVVPHHLADREHGSAQTIS
jgi:hypothetical protein